MVGLQRQSLVAVVQWRVEHEGMLRVVQRVQYGFSRGLMCRQRLLYRPDCLFQFVLWTRGEPRMGFIRLGQARPK